MICLGKVLEICIAIYLWASYLCLNFLLFCRLCLGERVPREIGGRPPCMPHPKGMVFLKMRPLQLVSKRPKFCRVILIAGVTTPGLPMVYPWRPSLGDNVLLRQRVLRLSPVLFLGGDIMAPVDQRKGGFRRRGMR